MTHPCQNAKMLEAQRKGRSPDSQRHPATTARTIAVFKRDVECRHRFKRKLPFEIISREINCVVIKIDGVQKQIQTRPPHDISRSGQQVARQPIGVKIRCTLWHETSLSRWLEQLFQSLNCTVDIEEDQAQLGFFAG